MPVTLRKRLVCHGCGKKSAQTKGARTFRCEDCDTTNYYNDDGTIADPPADAPATPTQYATQGVYQSNAIFCSECLKNQFIQQQKLSEYLPDLDDPTYDEYEAALPKMKKEWEERYPTCCAKCEPKVQAQLRQAVYGARADFLRRILDRSKVRRFSHRLGWRSLFLTVASIGYFSSLAVQLTWHLLGSQAVDLPYGGAACCLTSWPPARGCEMLVQDQQGWALLAGLLCSWWNPKWAQKLRDEGRLDGLAKYYALQLVTLLFRLVVWSWLTDFSPDRELQLVAHSASLMVLLALSLWAQCTVQIDNSPRVNWEYSPQPLVSKKQYAPPAPPPELPTIDLNTFATPARPSVPQMWRPPTPPKESDKMDWTPSRDFDQLKQPRYKDTQPSPFYGTLPALPNGPQRKGQEPRKAIGLPPGHFDKRDPLPTKSNTQPLMTEPKFFPQTIDTGLENIFVKAFSLDDGPSAEQSKASDPCAVANTPPFTVAYAATGSASRLPLTFGALETVALALWVISDRLLVAFPHLKQCILVAAAVAIGLRGFGRSIIPAWMTAAEAVTLTILAAAVFHSPNKVLEPLGAGLFALLIAQEFFTFLHLPESIPINEPPAQRSDASSPQQLQQPPPISTPRQTMRRRSPSVESTASGQSIASASTAPTPVATERMSMFDGNGGLGNFGLSNLRLQGDTGVPTPRYPRRG